jgi:hypothetical protein
MTLIYVHQTHVFRKKFWNNDRDPGSTEMLLALFTSKIDDLQRDFEHHSSHNRSRTGL